VTTAAERAGLPRGSGRRVPALEARVLGHLAAGILRAEAMLTPKPGLVDQRGPGAHDDMDLAMFLRSAAVLEPWFATLARAAAQAPRTPGAALRLRRDLGRIGRRAEAEMLAATGGVNTHRGALYSLGFLVAGAAYAGAVAPAEVARAAGELARRPDIAVRQARSHGDLVRDRHPRTGAAVHAATGFPVTIGTALPALRAARLPGAREQGAGEQAARLDALLAVMAVIDDTCVLYRGGAEGLGLIRRGAAAVLVAGGTVSPAGRRRLDRLDHDCRARRLSPGGAADVLATAMFLDQLEHYGDTDADPKP
jgi:triphosphoribosyl-dephospho-CoA synthase